MSILGLKSAKKPFKNGLFCNLKRIYFESRFFKPRKSNTTNPYYANTMLLLLTQCYTVTLHTRTRNTMRAR